MIVNHKVEYYKIIDQEAKTKIKITKKEFNQLEAHQRIKNITIENYTII